MPVAAMICRANGSAISRQRLSSRSRRRGTKRNAPMDGWMRTTTRSGLPESRSEGLTKPRIRGEDDPYLVGMREHNIL